MGRNCCGNEEEEESVAKVIYLFIHSCLVDVFIIESVID
jgi:hypothetical protein